MSSSAGLIAPDKFDLTELYAKLGAKEHPVLALPSEEAVRNLVAQGEAGLTVLKDGLSRRAKLIKLMKDDPLHYGWEPECWRDAREILATRLDLLIMGGNRSAKTEFAAKEAVIDLVNQPNRIWAFFHSSEDSSRRQQHPRLHQYLPQSWRDAGKVGRTTFVCYTEKGGFTDNVFILPNGSRAYFFNYKQDVKVLEGYEFDGVWADELIPPEFVQALRFRLITRMGRLIITFTPVDGYTPTVGDYLAAAKPVKSLPSVLLPGENVKGVPAGEMPYVMECVHPKRAIIFFFTEFNKFNPYAELVKTLETVSTREVKIRAYGYPDRAKGNVFPMFGAHNIIPKSKIPKEGTNYLYLDFAWGRNWVLLWLRVWEVKGKKRIFVWREWPDFGTYGEWVVPSKKVDGDRGPAQTSLGWGYAHYKKLIRGIEKEAGALIYERRCDPRSGSAEALTEAGGTCIMDQMREDHGNGQDDELAPMDILPASGDNITSGVAAINKWLEYDDSKPIDLENEPMLYISEECRNLIDCLRMWTGGDGLKGASKDLIDVLRYAATDDISFMEAGTLGSSGGGSY